MSIDTLKHDPRNSRKHSEKNLKAIRASLRSFGQQKPIVVMKSTKVVIAGNGTLEAARSLGWEKIAVVWFDGNEKEARAFALADNRTSELADWDFEMLAEEAAAAIADGFDIGFDQKELDRLSKSGLEDVNAPSDLVFRVEVLCKNETEQASLVEELEGQGYKCKLLMS